MNILNKSVGVVYYMGFNSLVRGRSRISIGGGVQHISAAGKNGEVE